MDSISAFPDLASDLRPIIAIEFTGIWPRPALQGHVAVWVRGECFLHRKGDPRQGALRAAVGRRCHLLVLLPVEAQAFAITSARAAQRTNETRRQHPD
jgi:hypothetical protein